MEAAQEPRDGAAEVLSTVTSPHRLATAVPALPWLPWAGHTQAQHAAGGGHQPCHPLPAVPEDSPKPSAFPSNTVLTEMQGAGLEVDQGLPKAAETPVRRARSMPRRRVRKLWGLDTHVPRERHRAEAEPQVLL